MAEKLFMSSQELRGLGLSEPMIVTFRKLAEFVDTQTRLGEAEEAIDGKQDEDATLTALAALDATPGIIAQTGADTFAKRTLSAPAAGFSITNPAGTAGDPTFVLANDLAALEALTGTDTIYYRSGTSTWTAVTIGANLAFAAGTLSASGGGAGGVSLGLLGPLAIGMNSQ